MATFTLILAILGGIRYAPQAIPWLVGLTITAAYWFTASTSFANPAVTLARGFTTTFAGIAVNHVPAFIVAQLVGAAIGGFVASVLFRSGGAGGIEYAKQRASKRSLNKRKREESCGLALSRGQVPSAGSEI